jgi:hypothetical protein
LKISYFITDWSLKLGFRAECFKMKLSRGWLIRLVFAGTLALAVMLVWQRTKAQEHIPVHMTTDWSNRHMIYSAPSTLGQAWRLQAEPRYHQQLMRRNLAPSGPGN